MTPKEKAQELVDKFKEINEDYIDKYQSIPCALISVNEILDVLNGEEFSRNAIFFWSSVKQEIENL